MQAALTTVPGIRTGGSSSPGAEPCEKQQVVSLQPIMATPVPSGNAPPPEDSVSQADQGLADYRRLQRRLLLATLLATALAVPLAAWLVGGSAAASLLLGGLSGLAYLALLARSVSRLGVSSRSVSKVQLLVPVLLVIACSRLPQLQIVPALIGFLLYKPALLIQAVFDA